MVFGLPAWNYYSRANFYQRYRQLAMYIFVAMTSSIWVARQKQNYHNEFVKGSLHYTTDDSDFEFRNSSSMTDGVIRRKLRNNYRTKILSERAALERELQLDAFNHLYKANLKDE